MTPVALTFAMVGQPNGLLNLATVLAARTAPSALLSIFGGWSADSISRKHTIIISDLIRFLSVGELSRVIAVCVSISVIFNPIAFLVTNPLVDTFGSHRLLIFGGWFTLISTAFVLWAVRPSKTVDIYLAPL